MTAQVSDTGMETRFYPQCCTSAFCGGCGDDCLGCKFEATKNEFQGWVEKHEAVKPDPIWSPSLYQATI